MRNQLLRFKPGHKFYKNLKKGCTFIIIPLLILWGCTKLTQKEHPPIPENWAKEWYYAEFKKSTIYKTSKIQHYPDWRFGKHQILGDYTISEFPMKSSVRTSPTTYADIPLNDKKRISEATFERLIVGQAPNKKPEIRVVTYIPELEYLKRHNFDASDNKITALAEDFEGLILIHEWDGKFVTGFSYRNGKTNKTKRRVSYKISTDQANEQSKITTFSKAKEVKNTDKTIANSCMLTWTDKFKTYWSGRWVNDVFVEDDRWTVYVGVEDVQLVGDCGEKHEEEFDPIDPCDLFPCDDGSGGGTRNPPDPVCPTYLEVTPTVASGAIPSSDISNSFTIWGRTTAENVEVGFDVCHEGNYWRAILTSVKGNYSLQAQLLPGCSEVMGPGANTTSVNYCTQMLNLNALGNLNPTEWYMLSAVQAHEQVHEEHLLPALSNVVNLIAYKINALTVPYTGQPAVVAEDEIRNSTEFTTAISIAKILWATQFTALGANDHVTKTPQAEQNIVNPMITLICNFAMGSSLAPCIPVCY